MNIGTHFHYNSYIVFVSTHTQIGTPHKKALVTVEMEVNLLIELFSNVQFSPVSIIVSKLVPTQGASQN